MPQINLLIASTGKKKKVKPSEALQIELPKVASNLLPFLYVIIAVLMIAWFILSFVIMKDKKELANLGKKKGNFSVSISEIKQVSLQKELLKKRVELLESLSSRKVFWSSKLEQVAEFIPQGVWLTEISLDKLEPATKGTKKDKESQLDKFMLSIKGSAYAYKIQDAVSYIGNFNNLLKNNEDFARDFSAIELSNVAKSSIGKTDIMNFEFGLSLK